MSRFNTTREDRLDNALNRLDRSGRMYPAPVTNLTITGDPRTRGVQVTFSILSLEGIDSFVLLRNFSRDPGSAKVMHVWTRNQMLTGKRQTFPIFATFADADPAIAGQVVYYWIKTVPARDRSGALLDGPVSYDATADPGPPGPLVDFDMSKSAGSGGFVTLSVSYTAAADGKTQSVKIYARGYNGIAALVAVAQAERSPFTFKLKQTGEAVTFVAVAVSGTGREASSGPSKALTLNAAETVPAKVMGVTLLELSTGMQVSWTIGGESDLTNQLVYRAARGAGFGAAVQIGTVAPSAGTTAYSFLDTTGRAAAGPYEYYVVAVGPAGNSAASSSTTTLVRNLALTDVIPYGSTPASWGGALTYSTTTTTVTWSWSGIVVYRPDGTTSNIPNSGGGGFQITGLVASTTYNFYPYVDEVTLTMQFVTGGANSTGAPASAFTAGTFAAVQAQGLVSHIPWNGGAIQVTTPASGTGGGTKGGSGGNQCLREGMVVEHDRRGIVPVEECVAGEWIRGRTDWRQIEKIEILEQDVFIRITASTGDRIQVTPSTPIPMGEGGAKRAQDLSCSDIIVHREGLAFIESIGVMRGRGMRKVALSLVGDEKEYWAGEVFPTILTHNVNPC